MLSTSSRASRVTSIYHHACAAANLCLVSVYITYSTKLNADCIRVYEPTSLLLVGYEPATTSHRLLVGLMYNPPQHVTD